MKTNRARIFMPNPTRLAAENAEHAATDAAGAVRRLGFSPAFLDCGTMRVLPARLADGTPAPYHCLDGLPDEAVLLRLPTGRLVHAKRMLIPGFERGGFFYTRTAAARACEQWDVASARPGRRRPPEC